MAGKDRSGRCGSRGSHRRIRGLRELISAGFGGRDSRCACAPARRGRLLSDQRGVRRPRRLVRLGAGAARAMWSGATGAGVTVAGAVAGVVVVTDVVVVAGAGVVAAGRVAGAGSAGVAGSASV